MLYMFFLYFLCQNHAALRKLLADFAIKIYTQGTDDVTFSEPKLVTQLLADYVFPVVYIATQVWKDFFSSTFQF